MNEIEKMYENAGIKLGCCKYARYGYEGEEGTWYYCTKDNKECWTYPNGDANCVEKDYLTFTAEKQLKLIKWISAQQFHYILGRINGLHTFEASLARLINRIWQALSEEEKQQIKEIL